MTVAAAGGAAAGGAGASAAGAGAAAGGAGASAAGAGAAAAPAHGAAAAAVSAPPAAGAAAPAAAPDWMSGLADDQKGYVQNKGWKGPNEVIDSYRNFEKFHGVPQEQLLRIPKAEDSEGWTAAFDKLGRPATPDGYKLEAGDKDFTKWAQETFHKAGLTADQAKGVFKGWNEQLTNMRTQRQEALKVKNAADVESLKKEWGAAHEQNIGVANRAIKNLGISLDVVDGIEAKIGFAGTMKLLHSLGKGLGEASFVSNDGHRGGGGNGPMTPQQARDRIETNKGDSDFVKRYLEGGSKERAEMEMLHKYANPESN